MDESQDNSNEVLVDENDPLAALKTHMNKPAADPSPRKPTLSTSSSPADILERQMQADGHATWGYVIYRSTYESDKDWSEFLRRVRVWMQDAFDFCNGQDILDLFTLTIFDDRPAFDGVDAVTIRNHFKQWSETSIHTEQPATSADARPHGALSPRYRFCIQVDAESLASVVHDAPPPEEPDGRPSGWVRLIDKTWILRSDNPLSAGRPPDPRVFEPIEGITDSDVGWMKCQSNAAIVEWYYLMGEDRNGWPVFYRRPPQIVE